MRRAIVRASGGAVHACIQQAHRHRALMPPSPPAASASAVAAAYTSLLVECIILLLFWSISSCGSSSSRYPFACVDGPQMEPPQQWEQLCKPPYIRCKSLQHCRAGTIEQHQSTAASRSSSECSCCCCCCCCCCCFGSCRQSSTIEHRLQAADCMSNCITTSAL